MNSQVTWYNVSAIHICICTGKHTRFFSTHIWIGTGKQTHFPPVNTVTSINGFRWEIMRTSIKFLSTSQIKVVNMKTQGENFLLGLKSCPQISSKIDGRTTHILYILQYQYQLDFAKIFYHNIYSISYLNPYPAGTKNS